MRAGDGGEGGAGSRLNATLCEGCDALCAVAAAHRGSRQRPCGARRAGPTESRRGRQEEERMEEVVFRREGAVEVITLNRPQVLNALNLAMLQALTRRFEELQQDDGARAVVVTGAGRGFCTGADLAGGGPRHDTHTPVGMRLSTGIYSRLIHSVVELEKPVVGAINGEAAGAGCNFALACDLLIASEKARFTQVFVRRGLVADAGGTYFLPRLVGLARAKELMFLGETVDAQKALELGLVNAVVPEDGGGHGAGAAARVGTHARHRHDEAHAQPVFPVGPGYLFGAGGCLPGLGGQHRGRHGGHHLFSAEEEPGLQGQVV